MKKNLLPCIYLKNGKLVSGFRGNSVIADEPVRYVEEALKGGADSLLVFDLSKGDEEHELNLTVLREITKNLSIPVIGAGNIKRGEDVKKLKYAGCEKVAMNMAKQTNIDLIEEVSKRFGKDSIYVCVDVEEEILNNAELIRQYVSGVILLDDSISDAYKDLVVTCVVNNGSYDLALKLLRNDCVSGISGSYVNQNAANLLELKQKFKADGLDMQLVTAKFAFEDFKPGPGGLVPVVVQDDATSQVLMVAYMNKEAYEKTIESGRMTYFSRSRSSLWLKGETSGHFQYVRSLYGDCDMDTILARVKQIGAACHTGSYSCFFNEILTKEGSESKNPMRVFEDVFSVILDRKENPKEGSYTNYLFDKGIDKILKKVGEEATEIVIAAKNPNKEEVRYEMADFLYHMMVLMAECGLTWSDITEELANR